MHTFVTKSYSVLGKNLNVAEIGAGEPLVLIHGWSNNWQGWTLLSKQLAPHYKIYMIDLPGYGDSDRLPEYSLEIVNQYIHQFLKDQHIHPKAIISASLGTIVAAHLLENQPHLSNKLILLGAVFNRLSLQKAARIFRKILELSGKTNPTSEALGYTIKSRYTAYLVERFINSYKFDRKLVDKYSLPGRKKMTGKSYIQLGLSAGKFRLEDYLKNTQKPTLLIYGAADRYVKPEHAISIINDLKNPKVSLHVIPECGHNPAFEKPHQTTKAILDFLEKK